MAMINTRKKDYEAFKSVILQTLQGANKPLTWTEIRERAILPQKFPHNRWVRWMEEDIGLIREKTKQGTMLWKLN